MTEREEEIVIWSKPPPWSGAEVAKKAAEHLKGRIREGYLFGSYATDEADDSSDIDFILVAETSRPFPDRGRDFFDLYDLFPGTGLDLIVYTPGEWTDLGKDPTGFIEHAREHWRRFL